MIISGERIVYSGAAAKRILGISASAKVRVEVFKFSVWVHVKGNRPTFISKRAFLNNFAEWRREQSRFLSATQWLDTPQRFTVRNGVKDTAYVVECREKALVCTCEDYSNQIDFFGRGCCKHGYSVLSKIGLRSLSEYLETVAARRAA